MRFKTDENLPPEAAGLLQQYGHDALTVWDQNLRGCQDNDLASACRFEKRILVTIDLDFADIRAYPPSEYPGIIVLRLASQARGEVLRVLERLIPLLGSQTLVNRLWVVDEQGLRVRVRGEV